MAETPDMMMAQALWRQGLLVDPRTGGTLLGRDHTPLTAHDVASRDPAAYAVFVSDHAQTEFLAKRYIGLNTDDPTRSKGFSALHFMAFDILFAGILMSWAWDKKQKVQTVDQDLEKLKDLKDQAIQNCTAQVKEKDIAAATSMITHFHDTPKTSVEFNRSAADRTQAIALCVPQEHTALKEKYVSGYLTNGAWEGAWGIGFVLIAGYALSKAQRYFKQDRAGRDIQARIEGNDRCVANEASVTKQSGQPGTGMTEEEYKILVRESDARWEEYKRSALKYASSSAVLNPARIELRNALAAVVQKADGEYYPYVQGLRSQANRLEQSFRHLPLSQLHLGQFT